MTLSKEFKGILADRFTSAELADFLQISIEDFVEMFEDEIEVNYNDLCEFVGLREETGEDTFDDDSV
jgi:hypothetical protein